MAKGVVADAALVSYQRAHTELFFACDPAVLTQKADLPSQLVDRGASGGRGGQKAFDKAFALCKAHALFLMWPMQHCLTHASC